MATRNPVKRFTDYEITKFNRLLIAAGNYHNRSDGAVYVTIYDTTIFFSNDVVVGVLEGTHLAVLKYHSHNQTYNRAKATVGLMSKIWETVEYVTESALKRMVEKAFARAGRAFVDRQLAGAE